MIFFLKTRVSKQTKIVKSWQKRLGILEYLSLGKRKYLLEIFFDIFAISRKIFFRWSEQIFLTARRSAANSRPVTVFHSTRHSLEKTTEVAFCPAGQILVLKKYIIRSGFMYWYDGHLTYGYDFMDVWHYETIIPYAITLTLFGKATEVATIIFVEYFLMGIVLFGFATGIWILSFSLNIFSQK